VITQWPVPKQSAYLRKPRTDCSSGCERSRKCNCRRAPPRPKRVRFPPGEVSDPNGKWRGIGSARREGEALPSLTCFYTAVTTQRTEFPDARPGFPFPTPSLHTRKPPAPPKALGALKSVHLHQPRPPFQKSGPTTKVYPGGDSSTGRLVSDAGPRVSRGCASSPRGRMGARPGEGD
jgi:hypothetical protein